ncbi:ANKL1 protein, partial [Caloenas nicobarica]|nr:ANKL1 protein [Caloenas nicobarica]
SAREVTPRHVTVSRGDCGCLQLLLRKGRDPELQHQEGKGAIAMILRDLQRTRGWDPTEDPWGPRRSLSFLTEDDTEGSITSAAPNDVPQPLSSTRRSLLEELGGSCGLGDPLLWWGCPPAPPALPAVPPQPLASSTLLLDGDELGEGPQMRTVGTRTGGPPWAVPKRSAGDSPGPSPRQDSSPTVLLVPGDTGHPQATPRDAQGSPCAAGSPPNLRMLEGGSGWHDPSPLGTHQPLWPHGSSSHLLATRPPAVLLSPTGCSTRCTGEHPEDEEGGQAPAECHSPSTEATSSPKDTGIRDGRGCRVLPHPLSDESLRRRLRALGDNPGHSPELVAALRTGHIPDCAQDELVLAQQFDRPDRSRRWREGLLKSSFNYLLLDPRITQNLPLRSHCLSPAECFRTFVKAIFYVGKGTRARPYCHFTEALSQHRAGTQRGCPKVRRILEIWVSGQGVVSVLCFQNSVPAEAYTRESCLVEALGLQTITNQRKGNCYGAAASWPAARRQRLGVHMLHRALRIFLAEGERQLRPHDIPGG